MLPADHFRDLNVDIVEEEAQSMYLFGYGSGLKVMLVCAF